MNSYKEFLVSGGTNCTDIPSRKRKSFRRRAKDFTVQDGRLYYTKTPDLLRLALGSKNEQDRAFQASAS